MFIVSAFSDMEWKKLEISKSRKTPKNSVKKKTVKEIRHQGILKLIEEVKKM